MHERAQSAARSHNTVCGVTKRTIACKFLAKRAKYVDFMSKSQTCDFDHKVLKYVKTYVLCFHIFVRPFLLANCQGADSPNALWIQYLADV
jgi:hypothetical protein